MILEYLRSRRRRCGRFRRSPAGHEMAKPFLWLRPLGRRRLGPINSHPVHGNTIIHAMARYLQKRKRSSGSNYASKKRKRNFKRKGRRGLRMSDQTSLNTKGTSNGFSGRKTSRAVYRRHLWNSTLFATHWRSLATTAGTVVTPASAVGGTFQAIQLMKAGGTIPFYLSTGGLISDDTGITVPTFKGDIILRGGRWNFTIHNTSAASIDVKIKTWLVWTVDTPVFGYEPSTAVSLLWEPSVQTDWNEKIGKVISTREVLLEQGNNWSLNGKYKLQKIDQERFLGGGHTLLLVMVVSNIGFATSHTLSYTFSHNVSFSGDMVT